MKKMMSMACSEFVVSAHAGVQQQCKSRPSRNGGQGHLSELAADGILDVDGPGTLTVGVANLAVGNGRAFSSGGGTDSFGGGIRVADETVTLTNVVVSGNTAARGGGVYVGPGGRLVLDGSTLTANSAGGSPSNAV